MKIIGTTQNGMLLEASHNELANLVGYYCSGADGCPRLRVGDEIKVAAMFDRLREQRCAELRLRAAVEELRKVATNIDAFVPIVREALDAENSHAPQ